MKGMDLKTVEKLYSQGIISKQSYNELTKKDNKPVSIKDAKLGKVMREFETYLKDEFSHNTASGYSQNTRAFIESYFEDKNIDMKFDAEFPAIIDSDVQKWFDKLSATGYTPASVKRFKHALKNFFDFLKMRYNTVVPDISDVDIPKNEEGLPEIDALRDEEIRSIADHAVSLRDKVITLFMYETGMRRQELVDCEKKDVDFDKNMVNIYINGKIDRVGYFSQETNKLLKEYLEDWAMEVEEINAKRYARHLSKGDPYVELKLSKYLFQTIKSPQMSYATVFKAIKDASMEYYLNKYVKEYIDSEVRKLAQESTEKLNTETLRQSRRAYLFSIGKTVEQVQLLMGDENWWVCKRYLKVAQQLYPENFV